MGRHTTLAVLSAAVLAAATGLAGCADSGSSDSALTTSRTTTTTATTTTTTLPSRPAPTDDEVKEAFQAFVDERAASGVMLAEGVTDVSVSDGVVTIILDADPVLLEMSPYDNYAELFGVPVMFNDEDGVWLRQTVQRVDVVDAGGHSMGSMTAAELHKKGAG